MKTINNIEMSKSKARRQNLRMRWGGVTSKTFMMLALLASRCNASQNENDDDNKNYLYNLELNGISRQAPLDSDKTGKLTIKIESKTDTRHYNVISQDNASNNKVYTEHFITGVNIETSWKPDDKAGEGWELSKNFLCSIYDKYNLHRKIEKQDASMKWQTRHNAMVFLDNKQQHRVGESTWAECVILCPTKNKDDFEIVFIPKDYKHTNAISIMSYKNEEDRKRYIDSLARDIISSQIANYDNKNMCYTCYFIEQKPINYLVNWPHIIRLEDTDEKIGGVGTTIFDTEQKNSVGGFAEMRCRLQIQLVQPSNLSTKNIDKYNYLLKETKVYTVQSQQTQEQNVLVGDIIQKIDVSYVCFDDIKSIDNYLQVVHKLTMYNINNSNSNIQNEKCIAFLLCSEENRSAAIATLNEDLQVVSTSPLQLIQTNLCKNIIRRLNNEICISDSKNTIKALEIGYEPWIKLQMYIENYKPKQTKKVIRIEEVQKDLNKVITFFKSDNLYNYQLTQKNTVLEQIDHKNLIQNGLESAKNDDDICAIAKFILYKVTQTVIALTVRDTYGKQYNDREATNLLTNNKTVIERILQNKQVSNEHLSLLRMYISGFDVEREDEKVKLAKNVAVKYITQLILQQHNGEQSITSGSIENYNGYTENLNNQYNMQLKKFVEKITVILQQSQRDVESQIMIDQNKIIDHAKNNLERLIIANVDSTIRERLAINSETINTINESVQDHIKDLTNKVDELHNVESVADAKLKQLETITSGKITDLDNKINEAQTILNDIKSNQTLTMLQQELADLKKSVDNSTELHNNETEQVIKKCNNLELQLQTNSDNLTQVEEQLITKLQDYDQKHKQAIDDINQNVDKLKNEMTIQKDNIRWLQQDLVTSNETIHDLINEVSNEMQRQAVKLQQLGVATKQLDTMLEEKTNDVQQLTNTIAEQNKMIEQLNTEHKDQLTKLKTENDNALIRLKIQLEAKMDEKLKKRGCACMKTIKNKIRQ